MASIVSLFFRKKQPTQIFRTIDGQVTPLMLDATLKEVFTATAEATKHPIEKGADATDHIILRPAGLTLSGIITETPFDTASGLVKAAGATVGATIGAALGPFGTAVGAIAGAVGGKSLASAIFGSSDRELSAVIEEFVKARDARQPVDIQTGLKLYKSYALTSFSASRDKSTGGAINVDLTFEEMIFVESQTTTVAIPTLKGALNKLAAGRQSKQALDAAQGEVGSSLLKKIF